MVLYADDTTPFAAAPSVAEVENIIQPVLTRIWRWVEINRLVLNVGKTKSMLIGSHQKLKHNPELRLSVGGRNITQVRQADLLGFTVDQHLSWALHVHKVRSKMASTLASLRKYKTFFPGDILKTVIQSLVLSHLDYCAPILSSTTQTQLDKLQTMQNRAARLATNSTLFTSSNDLLSRLGWQTVKERLFTSTICAFHKILTVKEPQGIYDRVSTTFISHNHNTRLAHKGGFTLPKPKTKALTRTFLYRCTKTYNSLPSNLTSTNCAVFKNRIKDWGIQNKSAPLSMWW